MADNIREVKGLVNRDGWEAGPWDNEPDRVECSVMLSAPTP